MNTQTIVPSIDHTGPDLPAEILIRILFSDILLVSKSQLKNAKTHFVLAIRFAEEMAEQTNCEWNMDSWHK